MKYGSLNCDFFSASSVISSERRDHRAHRERKSLTVEITGAAIFIWDGTGQMTSGAAPLKYGCTFR